MSISGAGAGVKALGIRPFTPRRFLLEAGPGFLLCAAVAMPAWELSHLHPSLDALALSLILGMILGNVLGPAARAQAGVRLTSIVFVPLGIILYGTRLDFEVFARLPLYTAIVVVAVVASFYIVIMTGSRLLGIDRRTGLLIASGSAICGASAIAVLSPAVGARSRDTSMALIVTTTAGLTGALLYPIIADAFNMSDLTYGLLCGSTLQQTGIVKLAASHLGSPALDIAVPVKMMRIAMLAPVTVLLAASTQFRRPAGETAMEPSSGVADMTAADGAAGEDSISGAGAGAGTAAHTARSNAPVTGRSHPRNVVSRALVSTWFILVFLLVAVVFSFWTPAENISHLIEPVATIFLSMALASIGLTVDFDSILTSGSRPLLLGFAGWATVGFVFLLILLVTISGVW